LIFSAFVNESKSLVLSAIDALGYPKPQELDWAEPPNKEYGDLSFRVGFQLSKDLRKKPFVIASEIAAKINEMQVSKKYVSSIEAHPSGFLNFRMNEANFFFDVLLAASKDSSYGKLKIGEGKRVLVEHTSANPSGALHIGHLRNIAIGDSLARIFSFASYDTSVLNYIDDSGLQVASVILGMTELGFSENGPEGVKYDHYTHDPVYVGAVKRVDENPSLKGKQDLILKKIEERDPSIRDLVERVTDKILKEQLRTCWRFGAYYDLLVYESDIIHTRLWDDLFQELKKRGIAKYETEGKLAGCWIVTVKGETEGEDKVLVRSNGTATYVAKDTPFAALKMGLISDKFYYGKYMNQPNGKELWRTRSTTGEASPPPPVLWNPEIALTPIDDRQARLQRIIQYILSQLANQPMQKRYIHVGYAIVSLSPKTAESLGIETPEDLSGKHAITMKARRGLVVSVDEAIDAVKEKAKQETLKRNMDISGNKEEWVDNVAEKIAIAALRFSLLKQDLDKIIIFDLEESLKLIGETGPYLLYTYARASSILSKVASQDEPAYSNAESRLFLENQSEKELLLVISKFDIALGKSLNMIAPKWVVHYSYELCEAFNKFYETSRVVQEQDPRIREARILLVRATLNVLKRSLDLLGIEALDKI
jgi:arginyl-tRNA synthetase